MNLPIPTCKYGYTREQINQMFGVLVDRFYQFMNGQTVASCDCREYNHEKRHYQPTNCKHEPSTIYYVADVDRFIRGLPVID